MTVWSGFRHEPRAIAEHLPPLPLCWVAEGEQRGATVEEWEVTFDQVLDDQFGEGGLLWLAGDGQTVNCPECLRWVHA